MSKFEDNMEEIFDVTPTMVENAVVVHEEKPIVPQESKLDNDLDYD